MDIGPMKNVIQDLKTAFEEKAPDVHFGLYYSLIEWYYPTFLKDKESAWQNRSVYLILDYTCFFFKLGKLAVNK